MGFKRWKDKLGTWERGKGHARQEKSMNKGVAAILHDCSGNQMQTRGCQLAPNPTHSICRCVLRGQCSFLCVTSPGNLRQGDFKWKIQLSILWKNQKTWPHWLIFPSRQQPSVVSDRARATSTSSSTAFQPSPLHSPHYGLTPPTLEIMTPLQIKPSVQKGGARRELDEGRRGSLGKP